MIISTQYPLLVVQDYKSTKRFGPSTETAKTEAPCHIRYGTIKIPPCSKAINTEQRPQFYSISPSKVTSPIVSSGTLNDNQLTSKDTKLDLVLLLWENEN